MAVNTFELAGAPPADQTVTSGRSIYYGLTIRETAAAVASFNIRATSASGPIIDTVALPASGTVSHWFGPNGINAPGGIYFDVLAGAVAGSVYHG